MKCVLMTGATGFVGATLARRLLADGHDVHLIVRKAARYWRIEEIIDDLHFHIVDLQDREELTKAVNEIKPDWIFHLGVYGAHSTQTDFLEMIRTNLIGTVNLVEACLQTGFGAFINTGSSSEYGLKDHPPTEEERLEPNSHYAISKAAATQYCRFISQSHKAHIATLRLYSVYGPYEEPTRLMPTLIIYGLKGALPPLADPEIARDYVYIDDVVEAYIAAATKSGQEFGAIYNVGTGKQTTLREVIEVASRELEISVEPRWRSMPNRVWDTSVWVADSRKATIRLGWQPRHTFAEGFAKMVAWFRSDPLAGGFYRALG